MPMIRTGDSSGTIQAQIDEVYQEMVTKGYAQMARDWRSWAPSFWTQHPNLTLQQVFSVFVGYEAGHGIAVSAGQVGGIVTGVPQAAATGALKGLPGQASSVVGAITSVPEFLSRLTSPNTWLRVGEFVLGALLILAGALKLSGKSGDIGSAVKLATKVVK